MSEEVVKKIQKTQKLLNQFGAKAYAFDPGVRCYIEGIGDPRGDLDFGSTEWEWLEPLLQELVQFRKEKQRGQKERSR